MESQLYAQRWHWAIKCFYRLWFKKYKMKKDTILDALYSDLDSGQETEKVMMLNCHKYDTFFKMYRKQTTYV